MKTRIALLIMLISLLLPLTATAFTSSVRSLVQVANSMSRDLDRQLSRIIKDSGFPPSSIGIAVTVPVNINNFDKTNTLARQMSEEISQNLLERGYRLVELRRASEIEIVPQSGEFLLSRDAEKLAQNIVTTELVLTGTYMISEKGIRFNMRLLHTATTDVVAIVSGTVPIADDIYPLLVEGNPDNEALTPSVRVLLN